MDAEHLVAAEHSRSDELLLRGVRHAVPDDADVLLHGPNG